MADRLDVVAVGVEHERRVIIGAVLGPQARPADGDPRRDALSLSQLEAYARVYRRLLTEPAVSGP